MSIPTSKYPLYPQSLSLLQTRSSRTPPNLKPRSRKQDRSLDTRTRRPAPRSLLNRTLTRGLVLSRSLTVPVAKRFAHHQTCPSSPPQPTPHLWIPSRFPRPYDLILFQRWQLSDIEAGLNLGPSIGNKQNIGGLFRFIASNGSFSGPPTGLAVGLSWRSLKCLVLCPF